MRTCFMHELCVSSQDLMVGRGAEAETVVAIQFSELGSFGTYQTTLALLAKKLTIAFFYHLC
jgi:hypothetical protein